MDDHRDISIRLDGLTPHQLIDEIRQIREQYLPEVGSGSRVSWPESIRSRVLALARLGVARKRIAELTEIPAATIFLWTRGFPGLKRRGTGKTAGNGTFLPVEMSTRRTVVGFPGGHPKAATCGHPKTGQSSGLI
jgi:hypothetical protein